MSVDRVLVEEVNLITNRLHDIGCTGNVNLQLLWQDINNLRMQGLVIKVILYVYEYRLERAFLDMHVPHQAVNKTSDERHHQWSGNVCAEWTLVVKPGIMSLHWVIAALTVKILLKVKLKNSQLHCNIVDWRTSSFWNKESTDWGEMSLTVDWLCRSSKTRWDTLKVVKS